MSHRCEPGSISQTCIFLAFEFPLPFFTPQKYNTENSKQIFLVRELRVLSPYFHFILCACERLYIPTFCLPILLQEICGPILGIYKSLTGTWMYKMGLWPRNSFLGIHKWDLNCSVDTDTRLNSTVETAPMALTDDQSPFPCTVMHKYNTLLL